MIELPMTGFAGRSELKEEISGLLAKDIVDESLVINVYGDEGTGKSTLIAAVLGDFHKKNAFVVDIDLNKSHLRFPENALFFAIRQEIKPEFVDSFALFDLLYLMRIERIHGELKIPASKFFLIIILQY